MGTDSAPGAFELRLLADPLTVVRLDPDACMPDWIPAAAELICIVRTLEELSIVVPAAALPHSVDGEGPWRALRVAGQLSFDLVGVLASLTRPLADAGVSVFAISTYDTDYLLVPVASLERAVAALSAAGHAVHPDPQ
jgi:hypothetical protein